MPVPPQSPPSLHAAPAAGRSGPYRKTYDIVSPGSTIVYIVTLEGGRSGRLEVPIECADAVMDADVRAIAEHRQRRTTLRVLA